MIAKHIQSYTETISGTLDSSLVGKKHKTLKNGSKVNEAVDYSQ